MKRSVVMSRIVVEELADQLSSKGSRRVGKKNVIGVSSTRTKTAKPANKPWWKGGKREGEAKERRNGNTTTTTATKDDGGKTKGREDSTRRNHPTQSCVSTLRTEPSRHGLYGMTQQAETKNQPISFAQSRSALGNSSKSGSSPPSHRAKHATAARPVR